MNEFYVKINYIDAVKKFVNIATKINNDIDIVVGRYIIDAKSIMGIFTLDLTKKIKVVVHSDNEKELMCIKEMFKEFIVE